MNEFISGKLCVIARRVSRLLAKYSENDYSNMSKNRG